jgi:hypothetical protein
LIGGGFGIYCGGGHGHDKGAWWLGTGKARPEAFFLFHFRNFDFSLEFVYGLCSFVVILR